MRARSTMPGASRRGLVLSTILLTSLAAGCEDSPTDPTASSEVVPQEVRLPEEWSYRPGWMMGMTTETPAPGADRVSHLLRIDTASGAGTVVGEALPHSGVSLAFSVYWGRMYASFTAHDTSRLARMDPLTGEYELLGVIRDQSDGRPYQVFGMDFIGSRLYGVTYEGPFIEINRRNGLARVIGEHDLELAEGAYGATSTRDGVFYLFKHDHPANTTNLYAIDVRTGEPTLLAEYATDEKSIGLAAASDGDLYASMDEDLYRLDFAGAGLIEVGDIGYPEVAALTFVDEIAYKCPCGAEWRNHGDYQRCVVRASRELRRAHVLTWAQAGDIRAEAAQSGCGKRAIGPT